MQYLVRVEPGRMDTVKAAVEKNLLAANAGRNLALRTLLDVKSQQQTQPALMVRMLSVVIFLLLNRAVPPRRSPSASRACPRAECSFRSSTAAPEWTPTS